MADTASSEARLDAALARIADPCLGGSTVMLQTFPDEGRRAARAADRRAALGGTLGPLDGRIVSVKGLFDLAGEVTTAGSDVLRTQPAADVDAVAVSRLRAAGAVIVGRTHMTEFAFSAVGVNPHDGDPGNPHDRTRICGGSSSGAAISVVDGMAEIALGSDTGGSIRIPAALCGTVGFKPSSGVVPTTGAFSLSSTLDVVGPLARSVADCAATDAVLRGIAPSALPSLALAGISFTISHGRLMDDAEPAVREAFFAAVEKLRAKGAAVRDGSIEAELDAMAALDRIGVFTATELIATLADMGLTDLSGVDPRTRARIEGGRALAAADYVRMQRQRSGLIALMAARLASGEVLLLPTVPILAPPLAAMAEPAEFHRANGLLLRNTRVGNLFDLPAISLPLPVRGLPVGMMLMGRRGDDRRLLAIAAAVERALPD